MLGSIARAEPILATRTALAACAWPEPHIEDGKTIVVSPHRVFGPQTNDLVLQLRKRRISKVILGGMLANMCVESHLRDLLERGLKRWLRRSDCGPSASRVGYGYAAALINFEFLVHAVWTTNETVKAMERSSQAR